MQISVRRDAEATATTRVVPVFEDDLAAGTAAAALDRTLRGAMAALFASGDFKGRFLEIALLHPRSGKARRVLACGLGPRAALAPHRLRQVAAQAARRASELGASAMSMPLPPLAGASAARAAQALAEGAILGSYRFTRYRRTPAPLLKRVELLAPAGADRAALDAAAKRGARWAEAVCAARDLSNTPGDDLTPEGLAAAARAVAARTGAKVRVLETRALHELGMGALLAVGRGSIHPPCFVVLESAAAGDAGGGGPPLGARGRKATVAPVVLIGKGITFDTGGISLKSKDGMGRMKYDMSGAAAVLAVFAALPTLALPFPVIGLIPTAENMPGSAALKPGDIVRALDGTTIEVTNTDAEGRLVLADALGYARRFAPQAVVDLATLTGSIRVALGGLAAGLFTTDGALADELLAASAASDERLWRMPLWDEYAESLKSDVADLLNSAGPDGGSSIAASFLARFARGMRWAHIDIASTAWAFADRPHEPRGPTGFGVRLLLEWLSGRA